MSRQLSVYNYQQGAAVQANSSVVRGSRLTIQGNGNRIEASYWTVCGHGNVVVGTRPTVIGDRNTVTTDYATVQGDDNVVDSMRATVTGHGNNVRGDYATIQGDGNVVDSMRTTVTGNNNSITGDYAEAFGDHNTVSGLRASANGSYNRVAGEYSAAHGSSNVISGRGASATGQRSTVNGMDPETAAEQERQRLQQSLQDMMQNADPQTQALFQPFLSLQPTQPTQPTLQRQPIQLTLRGEDEAFEEDSENHEGCRICLTNKAVVASICCGKLTTCLGCARTLYGGKAVGDERCLNCSGDVATVVRIS